MIDFPSNHFGGPLSASATVDAGRKIIKINLLINIVFDLRHPPTLLAQPAFVVPCEPGVFLPTGASMDRIIPFASCALRPKKAVAQPPQIRSLLRQRKSDITITSIPPFGVLWEARPGRAIVRQFVPIAAMTGVRSCSGNCRLCIRRLQPKSLPLPYRPFIGPILKASLGST